jgi:hypothetical protein
MSGPVAVLTATLIVAILGGTGCAPALHPHTTVAGRQFPFERGIDVHEGQSREEIVAILGEP